MSKIDTNTDKNTREITAPAVVGDRDMVSSKRVGKCFNLFSKKSSNDAAGPILPEELFRSALNRERHRADRNGHGFSLVGFDLKNAHGALADKFAQHLATRSRVTDEIGWFDDSVVGILLFNTPEQDARLFAQNAIETPVEAVQASAAAKVEVDFDVWVYPPDWEKEEGGDGGSQSGKKADDKIALEDHSKVLEKAALTSEAARDADVPAEKGRMWYALKRLLFQDSIPNWKRAMDIVGALFGLVVLSPMFCLVALFIKMVSPGPAIFKQERVGFGGKRFTLWKFRTMHINNDTAAHQASLAEMIHSGDSYSSKPMVKLDDERTDIIRFGRFLRKACVDEFPQLVNVLRGEMSLIGPRPPIPYEANEYARWHNGRFDAVPGMTGLWQVSGKNDLTFNEMARLDIQYSRKMSPWLDAEILIRTPLVIVSQATGGKLVSAIDEPSESAAA